VEECNMFFSKLISEGHPHIHAFYKWVNPILMSHMDLFLELEFQV
jgi:hypothetical protein